MKNTLTANEKETLNHALKEKKHRNKKTLANSWKLKIQVAICGTKMVLQVTKLFPAGWINITCQNRLLEEIIFGLEWSYKRKQNTLQLSTQNFTDSVCASKTYPIFLDFVILMFLSFENLCNVNVTKHFHPAIIYKKYYYLHLQTFSSVEPKADISRSLRILI